MTNEKEINMADKVKKETKTASSSKKYKAVDPLKFKEMYTNVVPFYDELSDGESVVFKPKGSYQDKFFETWLNNNIIERS